MRAASALAAVADLLRRHATPPRSPEAGNDADLVRRRIAECLFIGSHAAALGLREHATLLQPARPGKAFEQPGVRLAVDGATLPLSRRLASELTTLEAHAAHYLGRTPLREPRGRPEDFVEPDRLAQAVGQWEVTAMRVLHAQPPSVRDLAGIAHTEQALLVHTAVMMNTAARAAVIDPGGFDRNIRNLLQDSQAAWGDVAASWPGQMNTPAPPSLAGVEASAQLHQALVEITRDGNGWATPKLIADRVHLVDVAGLLRDAVAASGRRAERFAELPAELAQAGQLQAPARLFATMESRSGGGVREPDSAVRVTDVANRRIVVVRPEQTADATAAACHLGRQLTSLTQVLETIPIAKPSHALDGPSSYMPETTRGVQQANRARAKVQLTHDATVLR